MAKNKPSMAGAALNKFAVKRQISNAQQLHSEGLLSDAELSRVIKGIDARRLPGYANGGEEIENAVANLDLPGDTA